LMRFLLQFLASALLTMGVVVALALRNKGFAGWRKSRQFSFSYKREPSLFSAAERSFFRVLEELLEEEYTVFGKVRIADLIKPANGAGGRAALNRIVGRHVDFAICQANDLSVIGVIELDDKSHGRNDRRKRDIFVDRAFASAGIPIIHFPARAAYDLSSIRDTIGRAFHLNIADPQKPVPAKLSGPSKVVWLCDFPREDAKTRKK
jgi:hypothetical protein